MIIILSASDKNLALAGQDVVRLFYPDSKISVRPTAGYHLKLTVSASRVSAELTGRAELEIKGACLDEEVSTGKIPAPGDEPNQQKRLVRLALFRLLSRYTGISPGPWGILTGIRPTKIVHRLLDQAWDRQEIAGYLTGDYELSPEKANLLIDLALRQRPWLPTGEQAAGTVSVYVGIPFCPTRCAYCSFPAYPVNKYGGLLEPFLLALKKEIAGLGQALADLGKKVQTIYLGGGTPTVLDPERLAAVLELIKETLVSAETVEITLEAGRPDTLTEEKLRIALASGVTRLSINPQTMNRHTLSVIGRHHTPEEVVEAVKTARRLGYRNINMDLIAGLPGENIGDIRNTLREIRKLKPRNLTVHTLAIKRASRIKEARADFNLPARQVVEQMLAMIAREAGEMGMHPYYLYRQKNMVGPLENVGYTQPGYDCIYNIQMIEERQTIIGLGGGAGSKFVEPGTWTLTSRYNPKDPATYCRRIDELIARKVLALKGN